MSFNRLRPHRQRYVALRLTKLYVLPKQHICAFCMHLSTNSDYFAIYSIINLLDFKTVVESVYCAVRSEYLNIVQVIHAF